MQIQAPSPVLTWPHEWVSIFKKSWTKEPPWTDQDLCGCQSAQLPQGGAREVGRILRARTQVPPVRGGTEPLHKLRAPPLPPGWTHRPAWTGSVPQRYHLAQDLPGCSDALVKCHLLPHHPPNLFSSPVGRSVLLLHYCSRVEVRRGVDSQLSGGFCFFTTTAWMIGTVFLSENQPLTALLSSTVQEWPSLQQKAVSCFLHY